MYRAGNPGSIRIFDTLPKGRDFLVHLAYIGGNPFIVDRDYGASCVPIFIQTNDLIGIGGDRISYDPTATG